jgi:hypothetical protein
MFRDVQLYLIKLNSVTILFWGFPHINRPGDLQLDSVAQEKMFLFNPPPASSIERGLCNIAFDSITTDVGDANTGDGPNPS